MRTCNDDSKVGATDDDKVFNKNTNKRQEGLWTQGHGLLIKLVGVSFGQTVRVVCVRGPPANGLHGQHMPDGTRVTTCVSGPYNTKEHVFGVYFAVQLVWCVLVCIFRSI